VARGTARRVEPAEKTMLLAEVSASEGVSPSFQRVTITGDSLEHFTPLGFDQWFRLFLPQPGHDDMRLPKSIGLLGYAKFLTIPKAERPVLRNYTVAGFRPSSAASAAELDIDFALHGDDGFASRWAASARPGDRVAILDEGILFVPPEGTRRHLIVTDETGLPALAGIGRSLPGDAVGDAVLEVADPADAAQLVLPPGVILHLLVRGAGVAPGTLALAHLETMALDTEGLSAFAIGESALATGARRHLVGARGVPKGHVTFCGYWKAGH
jgi:NADPH-dependent ferric siderophore reductase